MFQLTLPSEYVGPLAALPVTFFEAGQGGVHAHVSAPLVNLVGVEGANARHQRHCGEGENIL